MMTTDEVEREISRVRPGAVTCAARDGNSIAVLVAGRWVPVAARMLGGSGWANVDMPGLCANGAEVWPQSLYMTVKGE